MSPFARIVQDPIRTDELVSEVSKARNGAVLLFLGIVRDHNEGRAVRGIRYEAYEEMAREVLEGILVEAIEATGVEDIAAVHRVGELAIGETSLAIAVASPHRADAYRASREVIELVKRRLPVWKKELYRDGEEHWVAGNDPRGEGAVGRTRPLRAGGAG